MKKCPCCGRIYNNINDVYCLNDNYRLVNYSPEEQEQDQIQMLNQKKNNEFVPKCPTCGSPNIKTISISAKAAGAIAFGLLSKTARSQFKCNNCGYKW